MKVLIHVTFFCLFLSSVFIPDKTELNLKSIVLSVHWTLAEMLFSALDNSKTEKENLIGV